LDVFEVARSTTFASGLLLVLRPLSDNIKHRAFQGVSNVFVLAFLRRWPHVWADLWWFLEKASEGKMHLINDCQNLRNCIRDDSGRCELALQDRGIIKCF